MRQTTKIGLGPTYSLYYLITVSLFAWTLGFLPLHLKQLHFSPLEIALTIAAGTIAVILTSTVSLQLTHYCFSPRRYLSVCSAAALLLFAALFRCSVFFAFLPCWFLCMFAKRGADAVVDAQALRDSGLRSFRFERARLWGSIGFVLTNFAIGAAFDLYGSASLLPSGAAIFAASFCAAMVAAPTLSRVPGRKTLETAAAPHHATPRNYRRSLLLLITACFFVWASHAAYYSFFSIYLRTLGWSGKIISSAWNIGVIAEIVLFYLLHRVEKRFSHTTILRISVLAAMLRWVILAVTVNPAIILASQLLHGLSFGGCYVSSLKLIHRLLPDRLRDRGQGLISGLGQGLGSLAGTLVFGSAASHLGSYDQTPLLFLGSSVIACIGWFAAAALREPDR